MRFFSVDLNEQFLFMRSRQCGFLPGLLDANTARVLYAHARVLALSLSKQWLPVWTLLLEVRD